MKQPKNLRYHLTLAVALLAGWLSALAQVSFELLPVNTQIVGRRFAVTYRLNNAQGSSLNAPAIQGVKLLNPNPGVSTMQSYQNINGQASSSTSVDYTFTYYPEKEGTFTVPAATIMADGKKYTTQSAKFKVLPADQAQSSQGGGSYGYGYQAPPSQQSSAANGSEISKDDIFVRIILNKRKVYEQEAVECIIKLYTRYEHINSFMMTSPPAFDGFLIEEADTPAQLNDIEHYNGKNYLTAILKRCIIYPQKSGELKITSGKYDIEVVQLVPVRAGWGYSQRQVTNKVHLPPYSQTVNISPLPTPRPAAFTNAVGNFTIESRMTPQQLRTGEAASLEYIITGTGNIKYLTAPSPVIPSEFEQFTPKTDYRTHIQGNNVTGTMSTEFTLVPQSVGNFKIAPLEFVYFDPAKGDYITLTAPGYDLKVEKGSGTTVSAEQRDIEAKNTDILHIRTGHKGLAPLTTPLVYRWGYWAVGIALTLLLVGAFIVYGKQARSRADIVGRRSARASKVARKRLRQAEALLRQGNADGFHAALLEGLWGYLGDKLQMPASQLSRENISQTLEQRGADPAVTQNVIDILDRCEMARYTPGADDPAQMKELFDEASSVVNHLEKQKLQRK